MWPHWSWLTRTIFFYQSLPWDNILFVDYICIYCLSRKNIHRKNRIAILAVLLCLSTSNFSSKNINNDKVIEFKFFTIISAICMQNTHTCARNQTYTDTHIHAQTHRQTHTNTNTHTHTNTHTWNIFRWDKTSLFGKVFVNRWLFVIY